MKSARLFLAASVLALLSPLTLSAQAASGNHTLYGDLIIDESGVSGLKPLTFDLILYSETGVLVGRQPTANNGRYRFNSLPIGVYQLAIEVESAEVARLSVDLRSPLLLEVRRDISLEWRSLNASSKPAAISASDNYVRNSANQTLFNAARNAAKKKRYDKAAQLLQQIVKSDGRDFPAWVELANVHFLQKDLAGAENEYLNALDVHPNFFLALLNLGRLELFQKRYDVAIAALTKAVKVEPSSPDANYFLGEAHLQSRQGNSAVQYLKEALRLDPLAMAEVHLRLALLYHRAGAKDTAAAEYQEFLKKRPDYSDRKKLEKYIAANGKKS